MAKEKMVERNISNVKVKASAVFGKIAALIGYPLGVIFLIMLLAYQDEKSADVIVVKMVSFCILLICLFLIKTSIQTKRQIARFKKYTAFIYGQQISSLDEIAKSTSLPVDFVKRDLQKMISKGFFTDLEIDMDDNKVIAGSKTAQAQAAMQAKMDKFEKFTCPSCGGSGVKPKGEQKACEYCGNIII